MAYNETMKDFRREENTKNRRQELPFLIGTHILAEAGKPEN